jgi:hypothetical protein
LAGDFRSDAKLIVIVIISSRTKSDDTEIRDAILALSRMRNSISGVQIWILHSSEVPDDQLDALQHQQIGLTSDVVHMKYDIGPNNGIRPLPGLNKGLRNDIIDQLNACVDIEDIETTPFMETTPAYESTPFPDVSTTAPFPGGPMFTTPFDDPSTIVVDPTLDTTLEIFTQTMTLFTTMFPPESGSTIDPTIAFPPPPPPIGPPMLPPRLQKVLLDTAETTETPPTTGSMITEPGPTIASTDIPVITTPVTPVKRPPRLKPPPPPPPIPPPLPPRIDFEVVRTTTEPVPGTQKPRRFLPPPPPPPPPPPVPPRAILIEPTEKPPLQPDPTDSTDPSGPTTDPTGKTINTILTPTVIILVEFLIVLRLIEIEKKMFTGNLFNFNFVSNFIFFETV